MADFFIVLDFRPSRFFDFDAAEAQRQQREKKSGRKAFVVRCKTQIKPDGLFHDLRDLTDALARAKPEEFEALRNRARDAVMRASAARGGRIPKTPDADAKAQQI